MVPVDVVIVSFNSRRTLAATVGPLLDLGDVRVIVVDNASRDGSVEAAAALPVTVIPLSRNMGFAHGCNVGWRAGSAPLVLLLNPDATVDREALERLVGVAESDAAIGAVAPRIEGLDGGLELSQRRFPRLLTTFAQAFFLHRLFPRASWTDEVVRDPRAYERPTSPEWVSGACLLVRRELLERLGGLDEGFFMYCEDIDLCRRIRDAGFDVRFEPTARAVHEGGASAPRPALLPVLAQSRIRYARKHRAPLAAVAEQVGVALGAVTHVVVTKGGYAARAGHARALATAARRRAS